MNTNTQTETATREPSGRYEIDNGKGWTELSIDDLKVIIRLWNLSPWAVTDNLWAGGRIRTGIATYRWMED